MEHPFGRAGEFVAPVGFAQNKNPRFWTSSGVSARGFHEKVKLVLVPSLLGESKNWPNFYLMLRPADFKHSKRLIGPSHIGSLLSASQLQRFLVLPVMEQRSEPSNKLTLANTKDSLGMPQVRLNWKYEDSDTVDRILNQFATEMSAKYNVRYGSGRFRYGGASHHIGTTRMSESPETGIVDRNCLAFHTKNLFVTGSSVFPTAGASNPTLTIIALAMRLGDHIQSLISRNPR